MSSKKSSKWAASLIAAAIGASPSAYGQVGQRNQLPVPPGSLPSAAATASRVAANVRREQVTLSSAGVQITNPELVANFAHNRKASLAELNRFIPGLKPEQVTLSGDALTIKGLPRRQAEGIQNRPIKGFFCGTVNFKCPTKPEA
jgi:hypothetical protein